MLSQDLPGTTDISFPSSSSLTPSNAQVGGGRTQDHATYLVPRGTADIFFPSDFELLRRVYDAAGEEAAAAREVEGGGEGRCGPPASSPLTAAAAEAADGPSPSLPPRRAAVASSSAFLRRHYRDAGCCRTLGGYNPLLDDFSNTAVLTS